MLFISDLPQLLRTVSPQLNVLMFADDLVFYSNSREDIQGALYVLSDYCRGNKLEVNLGKTRVLKFRRGGRVHAEDTFLYNGIIVNHCNDYEYLGITVQSRWTFTKHLKKKRAKAIAASHAIKGLQKMSLAGALRYFRVMIEPIVTYALTGYWQDLSIKQLEIIDCCFFDFLKKVLGVSRCTRNRLVLLLCDVPRLTQKLVASGRVGVTEAFSQYNAIWEQKEIDPEFRLTPAVTQSDWQRSNYEKRHLVCRVSVHGFHYKLCNDTPCRERNEFCICKYCGDSASELSHVFHCMFLRAKPLEYLDL